MVSRKILMILLPLASLLAALGIIFYIYNAPAFAVSVPSGFYSQDQTLEVTVPRHCKVYYTDDNSTPTEENTLLYEEPIPLTCDEELSFLTYKFLIYDEKEETYQSGGTYTYVMGADVDNRFDTLVVSITANEEDLYGYENGIFVAGKTRDDFLQENPDLAPEDVRVKDPAGYNLRGKEGEREVHVDLFESTGELLLSQNAGLRISGNYTRGKNQKSFQLFSRKEYDEQGNFHVTLFPELYRETDHTVLDRDNRLLFRNSGDDFNHAFLRDTLIQKLSAQYGYPLAYTDRPASVYINGAYQGFYWVREPFQNGYMENTYGEHDGEFVTVGLNEFTATVDREDDEDKQALMESYQKEYQDIYDFYCDADMTDDTIYVDLNELIDVENYLQYYALELYIGNKDWPYNNVKAIRYVSNSNDYEEGTLYDGRYHFLLFDTDYSFHLEDQYTSYTFDEDNIAVLANNEQSPLFSHLMYRKKSRDYFVNVLCDLMNSSFAPGNVEAVIHNLTLQRDGELSYFLENSDLPDPSVSMDSVESEVEELITFAQNRPEYMQQFICSDLPVSTPYTLETQMDGCSSLSVNTLKDLTDDFTGSYYASCGLRLEAAADTLHSISGFLINGQHFDQAQLTLDEEALLSLLGDGDTLSVQVITTASNTMNHPIIYTLDTQTSDDCIILYNPTEEDISTSGLYVSDNQDNLKGTKLPDALLSPGETLTLFGKKNSHISDKNLYDEKLTFNLKKGETLYLSDEEGTILDSVKVPSYGLKNSVYQYDLMHGYFFEKEK